MDTSYISSQSNTVCKLLLSSLFFLLSGCLAASDSIEASSTATSAPCTLNLAISAPCSISTLGAIATTSMGANITSYTNATASTTVTAALPNGFYSGKTVSFTDVFLIPANIKSGISIFGVAGTGASFASNAFRDLNTTQLSAGSEALTYAGIALPASGGFSYRDIPKLAKDDDGTTGGSVTYVNRVSWPGLTCGSSGTIEQRIANCAGTLAAGSTWTATTFGNSGQSTWKIVTRVGNCTSTAPNRACAEVWRDESTQLLWSSKVSEAINWCKATGNNAIAGNPATDTDVSNFCNNVANQATAGQAISACFEDNNVNFTNTDAAITNSANGKGNLGKTSTPAVAWRLPTKADFEQANANGLRYVLPDAGTNILAATSTYEWTATVLSTDRANAWLFDSYLGYFASNSRQNTTYLAGNVGVRCIGR